MEVIFGFAVENMSGETWYSGGSGGGVYEDDDGGDPPSQACDVLLSCVILSD